MQKMMPLKAALAVVGSSFARFHHLESNHSISEIMKGFGASPEDHFPVRKGGDGAGHGRPRLISIDGALMLAVTFRLIERRIEPDHAFRIASAFVFLGETGNGQRAIVPRDLAAPRAPGALFTADLGETFLLTIPARLDRPEAPAVAIVPGRDLAGRNIMNWLGENDADAESVAVLNLSAIVAQIEGAARAA